MRKLFAIAGALALTGAMAVPAVATPRNNDFSSEPGHKVLVCHATSSANEANYWIPIVVDIASATDVKKVANHWMHMVEPNKKDGRADKIFEPWWGGDRKPTVEDCESGPPGEEEG